MTIKGYKHGLHGTRIYSIHKNMKARCYNPKRNSYKNYGARGVRVCDEWLGEDGVVNFYNWAMSSGYKEELTLDRKDVNGNYEPSNCRWLTKKEQSNNRRDNRVITFNGVTKTATEWSQSLGGERRLVGMRLDVLGWSIEKAVTTPSSNPQKRK
jgi:hypothetical protein